MEAQLGPMDLKYWVIGATYTSTDFSRCVEGTSEVTGPYGTKQEARNVWKSRAEATRSQCLTRYVIITQGV